MTEEYFENDGVSITLEWTQADLTDLTYSYHVVVVPSLPLNSYTSTSIQIKFPYNSPHNVSIVVSSCGQYNTAIFFKEVLYCELKFVWC